MPLQARGPVARQFHRHLQRFLLSALALAVARDFPKLPILLMTGYADQRERASGLEALICGVIAKPFVLADIRSAVASAVVKNARRP